MKRILSYGAGVQSTALLLASVDGLVPKLDGAFFADTHAEPGPVMETLWSAARIATKAGIHVEVVTAGDLQDQFANPAGHFSSMPLWTEDGGHVRRQCTRDFKVRPLERAIKRFCGFKKGTLPKTAEVEHWLGISTDEIQRCKVSTDKWRVFDHPLITVLRWHRQDCKKYLKERWGINAMRSACVGCPYRSPSEWRDLRARDPSGYEKAVDFDESIRRLPGMDAEAYVHRHRLPLVDAVERSDRQDDLFGFSEECSGVCGV